MKNVTNDFKAAIKTNGRQLDTKIKLNGIEFPKDMFNGITPSFNVNLFKTIMRGVEVDSNIYIPKLSELEIKSGVLVNDEYEYIDYGKYTAYKEPESNEDTKSWKTTVYDKILDSMIDYDLTVEYPISVRNYWVAIFNRLNWDISGIPETFTNSTKMINQDVHSGIGYTFRDVLDELCTISAVFVMDISGNPTIVTPTETNQVIDETYLKDTNVTVGEKVFFNSLVFARAEESDNIYRKDDTSIEENGLHEFRISDNQLLSTNDRVDYIDELWEYVKNFEYYSFDIDTVGVMFMEPVDRFTISANGNNYSTILLNDTTSITQGLTENMHSDVPEETETNYKYADSTDKRINQTYILVDKQNQKIQQVIDNQTSQEETINQVQTNLDKLTEQINQNIVIYKGTGVPTLDNYPANEWTTNELKYEHVGDLYYDNESKKTYRFDKTGLIYSWVEDTVDISEAIEMAEKALNVANDKRRVFVTEPTVPYDIGDLWTNGEDIFVCKTAKTEGQSFSQDDWENSNNYAEQIMTTNTKLNETISTLDGTTSTVANLQTTLNNDYLNSEQINAIVQGQDSDIEGLSGKISQLETNADGLSLRVSSIENNGVSKVSNTLIELGEEGIQISKSTDEFSSKFDNKGVTFSSYGKVVATYDKDGANIPNLTSDEATLGYLVIKKSETNGEKRTKIFWVGD